MTRLTDQRIDSLIERHVGGHEITDDEYRSMAQFARDIEAELSKRDPVAQLELIGYQWQRLLGNPAVIEPFWDDWTDCTKEQYEHALAMPDHHGRVIYASHDDSLASPSAPDTVQVPREPTDEMLYAAEVSKPRGYRDLYAAMIAAAPKSTP